MARSLATNDKIDCGSSATLKPTAATYSLWINYSSAPTGYGMLMGNRENAGRSGFSIYLRSTGHLAYYVAGTGPTQVDPGTAALSTSTWYNIVCSYDSTNGVKTFVNNSTDGTAAAAGNISQTFSTTFRFGIDDSTQAYAGRIALAGVWNTSLAAGEILALSRGVLPYTIRPAALIGYWPLDGLQSPEADFSGIKNNGTLTGTTAADGPPIGMFTPRWPVNYEIITMPLSQKHFRFRTDTSAVDATPTWGANEDAA